MGRYAEHVLRGTWARFKYVYYEIDEIPNPRPIQPPPQNKGQKWHLGPFFPQQIIFDGLALILYRKQNTRTPAQPNSLQIPYYGGA